MPVTEDYQTEAFFKASIRCIISDGNSILFWTDPWLQGSCIADIAPELVVAVSRRRRSTWTSCNGCNWPSSTLKSLIALRANAVMFYGESSILGANQLWKTRAPNMWLILLGRCWTSEHLHQHGLSNNGPCALCSQSAETLDHLFIQCVFSQESRSRSLAKKCGSGP
jgi:hypothetical protein